MTIVFQSLIMLINKILYATMIMKNYVEWSTFLEETINKIKHISLSSQTKIYLALSSFPIADLAFQTIENKWIHVWKTVSLAGLSAVVWYFANKHFQKKHRLLEQCKKDIEEQARQHKLNFENLELLLTNIPGIGVFLMDGDKYTRTNEMFAKMTGRKREDIVGKTDKELFPLLPEDLRNSLLEKNRNSLDIIDNTLDQETLEETICLPLDDGEHIIMLKKSPFIEHGEKRILWVAIDITSLIEQQTLLEEQKQLAEDLVKKAEESTKLKDEFLANMSHELRTPLNAIIGFSELLSTNRSEEKTKAYSQIINEHWLYLLELIESVLETAKLQSGMITLKQEKFSLQTTISDIVLAQNHSIAKRNPNIIILEDNSLDRLETPIRWDKMRIKQVLNNLIGNAVKFTEYGDITVSCPKIEDLWDQKKVYLSIKDTGIGIPEDKLDIIFERFRQVDGSSTKPYWGTWLWLSLSKGICELMGGDITVESKEWVGSTFTFSFLVKENHQNNNEKNSNYEEELVFSSSKK